MAGVLKLALMLRTIIDGVLNFRQKACKMPLEYAADMDPRHLHWHINPFGWHFICFFGRSPSSGFNDGHHFLSGRTDWEFLGRLKKWV